MLRTVIVIFMELVYVAFSSGIMADLMERILKDATAILLRYYPGICLVGLKKITT
jgi:hypothetical protein